VCGSAGQVADRLRDDILSHQPEVRGGRQQMAVIAVDVGKPLLPRTYQVQRIGGAEKYRRREFLEFLFHPIQQLGQNGKSRHQPNVIIMLHDLVHQGRFGCGQLPFPQMAMHTGAALDKAITDARQRAGVLSQLPHDFVTRLGQLHLSR
jgi:hypothetical protein